MGSGGLKEPHIRWVHIPYEKSQFWWKGTHCKVYGRAAVSPAITDELIEMPFGFWTRVGPRNHVLDRVQIPLWQGTSLRGEGAARCKILQHFAMSCAKRLNRSICRLACGLGWAEGSNRIRHLASAIEPSVCCGDAALCHITFTTCCLLHSFVVLYIRC